ncbi:GrpB family protein [Actinophytocola sp.]|uniref:GrpB family protein n=1 Tax=Actinophytocola sp. TaxID=1872138 RepID=UPI002ED7EE70
MDEQHLRAVTIGDLTPYATKVVVEAYDPRWPAWFEEDRALIAGALGERALSIEHTGSTSVPGLPAKPIIDISLLVEDTADEPSYVPDLEAAGYVLRIREPEWLEHRCLKRDDPHRVNLHVYSPRHAAEEIARIRAFRDWLRTHDDDRDRYAAMKRELATREWRYVQDYADAKTSIIEEILGKALA